MPAHCTSNAKVSAVCLSLPGRDDWVEMLAISLSWNLEQRDAHETTFPGRRAQRSDSPKGLNTNSGRLQVQSKWLVRRAKRAVHVEHDGLR